MDDESIRRAYGSGSTPMSASTARSAVTAWAVRDGRVLLNGGSLATDAVAVGVEVVHVAADDLDGTVHVCRPVA